MNGCCSPSRLALAALIMLGAVPLWTTDAGAQSSPPDGVSLQDGTYTVSASGRGETDEAATLRARRQSIRKAVIARIGVDKYKQHKSLVDEQITQYPDDYITGQILVDSTTSSSSGSKTVTVQIKTNISKAKLDEQLSSLALLEETSDQTATADNSSTDEPSPGLMTDLGNRGDSTSSDSQTTSATHDDEDAASTSQPSSSANDAPDYPYARTFPTFDAELGIDIRGGIPAASDITIPVSIGYDTGMWRGGITAELGVHRPNGAPSEEGTEADAGYALGASLTRTLFRARAIGFGARTRATLLFQQYQGECTEYAPEPGAEGPQCQSRRSEDRPGGALDLELSIYQDVPLAARIEGGLSVRGSTIYGAAVGGFFRASWGSTR